MNVFISCTKTKAKHKCYAKDMYKGMFKHYLTIARYIVKDDNKIFIMSAKYGILRLLDIITPYNETLCNANQSKIKEWGGLVYKQSIDKKIDLNNALYFLPKDYMKGLYPYIKIDTIKEPFKGVGLFERRKRLSNIVKQLNHKQK